MIRRRTCRCVLIVWRLGIDAAERAARRFLSQQRGRHWEDILRVVASIYTGTVRAYDVVRMLQRDGNPTPLGEAIASYGRIFKSLHILAYIDDETYRRDIKGVRNLQEGRHSLAATVFHGKKGELYERYHKGMEDQLGALGLVLNCIVLWNTRYMNAALDQLRAQGRTVLDADVARLSPFVRQHLNVLGKYSFLLPELLAGLRALRNPEDSVAVIVTLGVNTRVDSRNVHAAVGVPLVVCVRTDEALGRGSPICVARDWASVCR